MQKHAYEFTGLARILGAFAVMGSVIFAPARATAQSIPQAQPEEPRGGPHEGIKVHGHWVIEVRNPDGSLVSRTEFENAVDPSFGTGHLAGLLKQARTPGHWAIRLGGTRTGFSPPPACTGSALGGTDCWIVQPGSLAPFNAPAAGVSTNLVVGLAGASQDQLTFSGSVTVLADGKIDFVNTWQGVCGVDVAPQNCTTIQGGPLTFFALDPIPVQQGRIIQVTVTVSFS